MEYEALLAAAPPQDSPEFLEYLGEHNRVVWETKRWLVIENVKYHSRERPWHTAFHKIGKRDTGPLFRQYADWEWLKKAKSKQTVPGRFHIHFYRPSSIVQEP